jgi:hypothetical protein
MPLSLHTRTRLINRNGKKVRASRWLMEQELGRKLLPTEHVHHINGNPLDNKVANLRLMSANAHLRHHKQVYPDLKICVVCGCEFTVNPRKRKRNKCCSDKCAMTLRIAGRKAQIAAEIMRAIKAVDDGT